MSISSLCQSVLSFTLVQRSSVTKDAIHDDNDDDDDDGDGDGDDDDNGVL